MTRYQEALIQGIRRELAAIGLAGNTPSDEQILALVQRSRSHLRAQACEFRKDLKCHDDPHSLHADLWDRWTLDGRERR